MTHYSIKDLSQLSGIKAHTIRIWEKRYELITPKRTATNIRFYSDQDLKKILNVSFLNNNGLKISKIANLSSMELAHEVSTLSQATEGLQMERSVDELIFSMVDMDERSFTRYVDLYSSQMGFEDTMVNVIYPFLTKIGVLWQTGNINPAQEHFVSNLIRQKLITAIDKIPVNFDENSPIALLFLKENELHELGILFSYYLVKKSGYKAIYLGQHMPYDDVLRVKNIYTPDLLITYLINPIKKVEAQSFVNQLAKDFNTSKVLFSISEMNAAGLSIPKNGHVIRSVSDLQKHL